MKGDLGTQESTELSMEIVNVMGIDASEASSWSIGRK